MKKYFTFMLLAIFGIVALSCNNRDNDVVPPDTYSKMLDVKSSFTSANSYTITQGITINSTDVVLVYRNYNSNSTGSPVWQLLPATEYLTTGRIDYSFLFDTNNVEIYADFDPATTTPSEMASYVNNQTFRVVLVPASQGKNANLDYKDYNSVIKYYNIPDRK
ncbi:hypothetical protein [Kaistella jeonii]|uniref:Uncharacterized protein n=1 Tax=Kaistella jeonii TaxID=266749 RepID=A0A0C1FC29_9FLAO|nr:hypothetical protein [Kaistella jeonii]KIA89423.1 hypothetical protein OA86_07520 [Kaistella jeonii]SFC05336.1 hypothetical protein SAMN05421876_105239 [Kaistella jeonii]VEI96765.1 Uncharacterised protein [Kaistella jeonii]